MVIRNKMRSLFINGGYWDEDEFSVNYEQKRWESIPLFPNDGIPMEMLASGGMQMMRWETVEENMRIADKLATRVFQFNPKIKIFFTMLPRYYMAQIALEPHLREWRKIFITIGYI
ncbi:MAG: hypothetical protein K6G26_11475 [Lachnospiraceae bacterium]|nr:hypothetical protein [Lachnospiraceae bacterium]